MATETESPGSKQRAPQNYLFYFNWPVQILHLAVVSDEIEKVLQDPLAHVVFLYCDGERTPCHTNRLGDPVTCIQCQHSIRRILKTFGDRVTALSTSSVGRASTTEETFDYGSLADIRTLVHEGVNIGYAALSSYVSWTRNLEPVIDEEFRTYFDKLLRLQVELIWISRRVIEAYRPVRVTTFNGRFADVRPVMETAKVLGIPLRVLELVRTETGGYKKAQFEGTLPHDIDNTTLLIEKAWAKGETESDSREAIADEFFRRRRGGILAADRKVYTSQQQAGRMPDGWDKEKKNVVVFISSADEFAAIGPEFERLSVFNSQEEAVAYFADRLAAEETHLYVRVHPNLSDIDYGYHRRLYGLQGAYPNVTVIAADSPISTYALIDEADVIVTFGSSTGVEAAYSGKPVILLSGCWYYRMNVAYTPETAEEAADLLKKDLRPKPVLGAYKYAYFLLKRADFADDLAQGVRAVRLPGSNKHLLIHPRYRYLGSMLLYAACSRMRFSLARRLPSKRQFSRVPIRGL